MSVGRKAICVTGKDICSAHFSRYLLHNNVAKNNSKCKNRLLFGINYISDCAHGIESIKEILPIQKRQKDRQQQSISIQKD